MATKQQGGSCLSRLFQSNDYEFRTINGRPRAFVLPAYMAALALTIVLSAVYYASLPCSRSSSVQTVAGDGCSPLEASSLTRAVDSWQISPDNFPFAVNVPSGGTVMTVSQTQTTAGFSCPDANYSAAAGNLCTLFDGIFYVNSTGLMSIQVPSPGNPPLRAYFTCTENCNLDLVPNITLAKPAALDASRAVVSIILTYYNAAAIGYSVHFDIPTTILDSISGIVSFEITRDPMSSCGGPVFTGPFFSQCLYLPPIINATYGNFVTLSNWAFLPPPIPLTLQIIGTPRAVVNQLPRSYLCVSQLCDGALTIIAKIGGLLGIVATACRIVAKRLCQERFLSPDNDLVMTEIK